jgi:hypothetical protein
VRRVVLHNLKRLTRSVLNSTILQIHLEQAGWDLLVRLIYEASSGWVLLGDMKSVPPAVAGGCFLFSVADATDSVSHLNTTAAHSH